MLPVVRLLAGYTKRSEVRNLDELEDDLFQFYAKIRQQNGDEYKPDSLNLGRGVVQFGSPRLNFAHPVISKLDRMNSYHISQRCNFYDLSFDKLIKEVNFKLGNEM